jgi:hypothetical protein
MKGIYSQWVRLAILICALAFLVAGCGSHHRHHAAAQKRPPVTYVTKLVVPPGCQVVLPMTEREYRRWMRRCVKGRR